MSHKWKGLSDKDLRILSYGLGVSFFCMFTVFGGQEFSHDVGAVFTDSVFGSLLWVDIIIAIAGWFAILLFMWNFPHSLSCYKKR
ncbi:MAG: hypothetical protein H7836_11430 [Magnetococcus sp. YQC-3]